MKRLVNHGAHGVWFHHLGYVMAIVCKYTMFKALSCVCAMHEASWWIRCGRKLWTVDCRRIQKIDHESAEKKNF